VLGTGYETRERETLFLLHTAAAQDECRDANGAEHVADV
jgi:hypothetical protein